MNIINGSDKWSLPTHTSVNLRPLGLADLSDVLVLRPHLVQLGLVLGRHVGLALPLNDGGSRVYMLSVERALVLDGLDAVLVVVHVALAVDSLDRLGVLDGADVLLSDLGSDFGADLGRLGLVGRAKELLDAFGDFGHCWWFGLGWVGGLKWEKRVLVVLS